MLFSGDPIQFITGLLYLIPALLIGLTGHEAAHAAVAVWRGDQTPRLDGRVSLNPGHHLDPLGTLAVLLIGFGWAKPVRINPFRMRSWLDPALVALAGPIANLLIAVVLAIPIKLVLLGAINLGWPFWQLLSTAFVLNIVLAVFNLLPIPPLDGYSFLSSLFRRRFGELFFRIDMNRQAIVLVFIVALLVSSNVFHVQLLQYISRPVEIWILRTPPFAIGG